MARRVTRRELLAGVVFGIVALPLAGRLARAQTVPEALPDPELDPPPHVVESLFLPEPAPSISAAALDYGNIANLAVRVRLTLGAGSDRHADAFVSAGGDFQVVNAATGATVAGAIAGQWFQIRISVKDGQSYYAVYHLGSPTPIGAYTGPILVQPTDHNQVVRARNASGTVNRTYRGYLLVEKPAPADTVVRIVNVLEPTWLPDPMEKYLYGVVPIEMPIDYGAEALKAQAVAARTYAASRFNDAWVDVDDTTGTQVYYGFSREHANSTDAVNGTRGAIATYNGGIISALYASTCGGHTENNEHAYSSSPVGYLRGVRCLEDRTPLNLFGEDQAKAFWGNTQPGFCDWSTSLYRWSVTWDRGALESILNAYLPGAIGTLDRLEVLERGVSGKIKRLKVHASGGTWEISSDYRVRYVLRTTLGGDLQRSSNMVFTHNRNGDGSLASVVAQGGGWGHGVGFCQRGARGMASRGRNYVEILSHYYSGIAVVGGNLPPPAPTNLTTTSGGMALPSESITLTWNGLAERYHAQLFAGEDLIRDSGWIGGTSFSVGTFALGTYRYKVRAQTAGVDGPWSEWQYLHIVDQIHELRLPFIYR